MELIHNRTHQVITRHVNVVGGPVLTQVYSSTGKLLRVEHVRLEYVMKNGVWVGDFQWVELAGTVLKKDGSDSLQHHSGRYSTGTRPWLLAIVESLRPVGSVDLPFLGIITDPS